MEIVIKSLGKILEGLKGIAGATVLANGEVALILDVSSLVTMDITMPNLDGIAAIKEIVKNDPEAKIVVCSAMGQKALVIEALNAGAKDFIVKPFQPDRIIDSLKKFQ